MKSLRIGTGAGFSGDRIEPAVDLAARGELDYLVFECLAERTIALAQQARRADPEAGYDPCWSDACERCCPHAGQTARASSPTWAPPIRWPPPARRRRSPASWGSRA